MIRTELICTLGEFKGLGREWSDLLQSSRSNSLFLTHEWLHTWWRHLAEDRTLYIIAVRRENALIAIAPLALRPKRPRRLIPFRALEFVGSGQAGSDYLNLIVRRGEELPAYQAIAEVLENRNLLLQLSQMDKSSAVLAEWRSVLLQKGWRINTLPIETSPYLKLDSGDFDAYLQSRKHRIDAQRRLTKLRRHFSVSFETAADEASREALLNELLSLHSKRWQGRGGTTAFHTPQLQAFHDEFSRLALEKGWLKLHALKLDSRIAALTYCFGYDGRYYYYQSGFDEQLAAYSPGLCALALSIEQAMRGGFREFDFLRGGEAYKFLWTDTARELVRLDIFPSGLSGAFSEQLLAMRHELLRVKRKEIKLPYGA